MRVLVAGFICGALAVLLFHQATIFLLHYQFDVLRTIGVPEGLRPSGAGFALRSVPPFGVPQVVSLMFWGGVWGMLLAALIGWLRLPGLLTGFLLGAVACTIVGFTLVAGIRGTAMLAGGNPMLWLRAGLVNGAWGWGTAALLTVALPSGRH